MDRLLEVLASLAKNITVERDANGSVLMDGAVWLGEEGSAFGQLRDAAEHLALAGLLQREMLQDEEARG